MERAIERAPACITVFLLILAIAVLPFSKWGLAIIGLAGIFFVLCLKRIPAVPPHAGLVTIWGERKPIIKNEGYRLLATFPPFMYDVILVNVERKNRDFHPENVRTKEMAELEIEVSITWTPDKGNARNLIEYIDVGQREGVENILDDIIAESVREYAIKEGWKECLAANEKIARSLIQKITGLTDQDLLTIGSIRRGDGSVGMPSLGIVLNRLNIGTILIKGHLAEAAEKESIEERDRDAERVELDHVRARIRELVEMGYTLTQAQEIVQTERNKVVKTIQEIKGIDLEGFGEALRGRR